MSVPVQLSVAPEKKRLGDKPPSRFSYKSQFSAGHYYASGLASVTAGSAEIGQARIGN